MPNFPEFRTKTNLTHSEDG